MSALESEVSNLKERLEVRKLLDRAKGLLQAEQGMSEAEACTDQRASDWAPAVARCRR